MQRHLGRREAVKGDGDALKGNRDVFDGEQKALKRDG